MSKLSTFLQKERAARGWSMTDLAEKSGIGLSNISRWESPKNHHRVSHDNVLALARVFDMEPGDVLRYLGYPRKQYTNSDAREQVWSQIREKLEADPRAQRILELFDQSEVEDDKDRAVELLEVHFRRPHRPVPPE